TRFSRDWSSDVCSSDLIEAHHKKGHTVAIVSSATPYQVEPLARELNIDHVYCSRYEVKNGVFTGETLKPLCWGHGKVEAVETLRSEERRVGKEGRGRGA